MSKHSDLKVPFFTVLFIFLGIFLYTKLAGPIPFYVNNLTTTKSNLFEVSATAKETAVPNTAMIVLGITQTDQSVELAKNKTDGVMKKLLGDLKNLGVEEKNIQTVNYSVTPPSEQGTVVEISRSVVKNGYTVDQTIQVKVVPIEKANQIIDLATKDGLNQIGGVTFVLDDRTQKVIENKARKKAVQDAKEKAHLLASTAGIRLGRVVDVRESTSGVYSLIANDKAAVEPTQTTLSPGQNSVEITITLSFETY